MDYSEVLKSKMKILERRFKKQMKDDYHSQRSETSHDRSSSHQASFDSLLQLSSSMRHDEGVPPISPSSSASFDLGSASGRTSGSTRTYSTIGSRTSKHRRPRKSKASPCRSPSPEHQTKAPRIFDDTLWTILVNPAKSEDLGDLNSMVEPEYKVSEPEASSSDESTGQDQLSCVHLSAEEGTSSPETTTQEIQDFHDEDSNVYGHEEPLKVDLDVSRPLSLFILSGISTQEAVSVTASICPSLPADVMSYGTAQKYNIEVFEVEEGILPSQIEMLPKGTFRILGETEPVLVCVGECRFRTMMRIRFWVFESHQLQLTLRSSSRGGWGARACTNNWMTGG